MPHPLRRKRRDATPRQDDQAVADQRERPTVRRTTLADVYRRIDEDLEEL